MIGGVLAAIEVAAGLTTDLPEAAPRWLHWLAAASEAVRPDWLGPAVYWAVLLSCTAIVLYGVINSRKLARPGLRAIEVSFGKRTELNWVGGMTMIDRDDKPLALVVTGCFQDLRVTNNDIHPTTIEEFWLELDGKRPLETDKCEVTADGASVKTGLIGARRPQSFTVDYIAVFPWSARDLSGRVSLCMKAAGLGVFGQAIPDWMILRAKNASPQS